MRMRRWAWQGEQMGTMTQEEWARETAEARRRQEQGQPRETQTERWCREAAERMQRQS